MFLSPTHLIEKLEITKNATVIDFGAGSGAYVYPALRAVGSAGKVVAVDIDRDMLKSVADAAKIGGHTLHTLEANLEHKIMLPDYSAEYVILANTLYHIENKTGLLAEIKRILAPYGEVLFVEWEMDSKFGPDKNLRIRKEIAIAMFTKLGFIVEEELPAGDYHYAYILKI